MMVPRLQRRVEFLAVSAAKRIFRSRVMHVQLLERSAELFPETPLRVGFTASKRVGNAVVRNRAKRRLKAVVEKVLAKRRFSMPYDFVFIATPLTATVSFRELLSECERALRFFHLTERL